jgi:hypothetical protein
MHSVSGLERLRVRAFVVIDRMFEWLNPRFQCDGMPIGFRSVLLEFRQISEQQDISLEQSHEKHS